MADKRNRSIELKNYIESFGIVVNIGKNKARGNKGFFKYKNDDTYRIDISKNLNNDEINSVLLHEFAHYFHLLNDKTLNTLDFVFNDFNNDIKEELINITVKYIPKEYAKSILEARDKVRDEINSLKKQKITPINYYKIKHYEREYSRLSSRISKLNKYYQRPTELFARFIEMYYTDLKNAEKLAPNACSIFCKNVKNNKIFTPFKQIESIMCSKS